MIRAIENALRQLICMVCASIFEHPFRWREAARDGRAGVVEPLY